MEKKSWQGTDEVQKSGETQKVDTVATLLMTG